MLEMLSVHLKARHLPHVRRYYSQARQLRSRKRTESDYKKPNQLCALPLHLLDLARLEQPEEAVGHQHGWLYFLDWGMSLTGLAHAFRTKQGVSLTRLSLGSNAARQYRIMRRITDTRDQPVRCIEAPTLHFRALYYLDPTTARYHAVPLYSGTANIRIGRVYRIETILRHLSLALGRRFSNARQHQARRSRFRQQADLLQIAASVQNPR